MKTIDELKQYYHYKCGITVADCDVDFLGRLKPGAVMDYMQQAATAHAALMGCGYEQMRSRSLAWVVARMSVKIVKYPDIGDALTLYTFPEKPQTVNANRGFYIYSGAGEAIILGVTKWCVIDTDTHKIQRLAPFFEMHKDTPFIAFSPFEGAAPRLDSPASRDTGFKPMSFSVQLTDLDRNVHMNNARYGDIMLNVCGMDTLKNYTITRFDINFVSQLFYGDSFAVYKADADGATYIEAQKTAAAGAAESSAEDTAADTVFRARVLWGPPKTLSG